MRLRQVLNGKEPPNNKKKAYNFFVNEKGYRPEIALGIIGNLMQESGSRIDISAIGFDGTGSFGAAQWLGSRKKKLKEIRPDDYDTLRGQLEFIDWELNNTEKRAASKLRESKTIQEAAMNFSKYYERPHKDYAHNDKRVNYAKNLAKEVGVKFEDTTPANTQETELPQTKVDNTAVATQMRLPDVKGQESYTALPILEKEQTQNILTEEKLREILQQERSLQQQNQQQTTQVTQPQQEQYYQPQAVPFEQLYQIVDINQF